MRRYQFTCAHMTVVKQIETNVTHVMTLLQTLLGSNRQCTPYTTVLGHPSPYHVHAIKTWKMKKGSVSVTPRWREETLLKHFHPCFHVRNTQHSFHDFLFTAAQSGHAYTRTIFIEFAFYVISISYHNEVSFKGAYPQMSLWLYKTLMPISQIQNK